MVVNYKRRNKKPESKRHFVNEHIRVPEVRLIGTDGENYGVLTTREALNRAREEELDLVIITEKAQPPVAKIVDFSKFLYEERKKQSANKNKSAKSDTKEFIFGPNIGEGDLNIRIERTKEFLREGNRVKMSVRLSGRQKAYPELGYDKLNRVISELNTVAKVEEEPKLKGNLISVTFSKN